MSITGALILVLNLIDKSICAELYFYYFTCTKIVFLVQQRLYKLTIWDICKTALQKLFPSRGPFPISIDRILRYTSANHYNTAPP